MSGSKGVMKQLREYVSPAGKKASWMRHLNDRQLAEVYHRLKMGQSPYRIARIVQDDWGMCTKSEARSVARTITKFKHDIIGDISCVKDPKTKECKDSRNVKIRAKRVVEKLDTVGRLRWLTEVQTDRVEMWVEKEKITGIPLARTDEAVRTLAGLLRDLNDLQIKLGLLDAREPQIGVHIQQVFNNVLPTETAESLGMINATNKFIDMLKSDDSVIDIPVEDIKTTSNAEGE